MRLLATLLFVAACTSTTGDDKDTDSDVDTLVDTVVVVDTSLTEEQLCAGGGPRGVEVGIGTGGSPPVFTAFEDGADVGVIPASQGGVGVDVYVRTSGLKADDEVDILLVTEIDGVVDGSFLAPSKQLFCFDGGAGLVWGVQVGFDPVQYPDLDSLLPLDGQVVDLVVTVTDSTGDEAVGRSTVTLQLGT